MSNPSLSLVCMTSKRLCLCISLGFEQHLGLKISKPKEKNPHFPEAPVVRYQIKWIS